MFVLNKIKNIKLYKNIRFNSNILKTEYEFILAEVRGKVGLITLNRPKALNALCTPLLADITHASNAFDSDPNIGAIVITGSEKAFAAGADIKEMSTKTFPETYVKNMFEDWTAVSKITKPVSYFLNYYLFFIIYYLSSFLNINYYYYNKFRLLLLLLVMHLVVDVNLQ